MMAKPKFIKSLPAEPAPIAPRPQPRILAEPEIGPEERRRVGAMMASLASKLTYAGTKRRRSDYVAKPKTPEELAAEWAENPCGISPEALAALNLGMPVGKP